VPPDAMGPGPRQPKWNKVKLEFDTQFERGSSDLRYLMAFLILATVAGGAWAASIWSMYFAGGQTIVKVPEPGSPLETIDLGNGFYALLGAGGNITVSVGSDGILIVDTGIGSMGATVQHAVLTLGDPKEVRLVNTHAHGDHSGGNAEYVGLPAKLFLQDTTYNILRAKKETLALVTGLQTVTFDDRISFEFNGQDVELIHVPKAHTEGDLIAVFQPANIIATGDVFQTVGLPHLGPRSGGTLDGILNAEDKLMALSDTATKIVPGHGPIADRAVLADVKEDLQRTRDRLAWLKKMGVPRTLRVLFHPLRGWPAERQVEGDYENYWTGLAWDTLP